MNKIIMSKYLKSFVIGSSYLVFLPFITSVAQLTRKTKNYSYKTYSFIAPLYLGLMNALSHMLSKSLEKRLLLIGIISPIIVMTFATLIKSYNLSNNKWNEYYIRLFMKHFLIYNVIVYFLEKNM